MDGRTGVVERERYETTGDQRGPEHALQAAGRESGA
jgi:hypothetical protein